MNRAPPPPMGNLAGQADHEARRPILRAVQDEKAVKVGPGEYLMSVSTVPERQLDEALDLLASSEAEAIYLVDSFGALYSEQIHYLVRKYLHYAKAAGKEVGIHAHNNLQLAFANTVEAIVMGANMLDATMAGLGRGAGNCQMELRVKPTAMSDRR